MGKLKINSLNYAGQNVIIFLYLSDNVAFSQ